MGKIQLMCGKSIPDPERALRSGNKKIVYAACMRCRKVISYSFDDINVSLIKALGNNATLVLCCPRCYREGTKYPHTFV